MMVYRTGIWWARLGRCCACLGSLVVALLLAARPVLAGTGQPPRWAQSADLRLSVRLAEGEHTVSAGEPVLLEITLTNAGADTIRVFRGNGNAPATAVSVLGSTGRLLATTMSMPSEAPTMAGVWRLRGGENRAIVLVVNPVYQFAEAGDYVLRVTELDVDGRTKLCQDDIQLRVIPLSPQRLEERCQKVFRSPALELWIRYLALRAVKNEVVLPYLSYMATRMNGDADAVRAMMQVGTPRALLLARTLAERPDAVGAAARMGIASAGQAVSLAMEMGYH